MKRNAIIRIVLYSLALLILLALLGMAFGFNYLSYIPSFFRERTIEATHTPVPLAQNDDTVSTSLEADGIRELEINWGAGCITILPEENTTQITLIEPVVSDEQYQMQCRQAGTELVIEFLSNGLSHFPSDFQKDLTVTVPADWICNSLDINAGSSSIQVNSLTIRDVQISSASGICTFQNCAVEEFDIDAASGNVSFAGTLDKLDFDAASADCHVTLNNVPYQIEMDSMSGNLVLELPEDAGFNLEMDTLSGDFTSDFTTSKQNGRHVHGNGSCHITISALSGDVTIRKNTAQHVHDENCYGQNSTCPDPSSPTSSHHVHDESCFVENSTCPDQDSLHHS